MTQAEKSAVAEPGNKLSVFVRLRIPMIIAGGVLGAIVFLLIGLGLGKVKLSVERKQFTEKAAAFNERLKDAENEKKIYEVKAEGLKKMHDLQKSRADELQKKLEETTQLLSQAQQSIASATASASATSRAKTPEPKQYLRFGNVDCTVGTQAQNNDWKACLKQGRVVSEPARQVETAKPKPAH